MTVPTPMSRVDIATLIPHGAAMCLLARMDAWDERQIACAATNHRDTNHPLRTRSGLMASCAIEYAAQAMALHGALVGRALGTAASPGYLASARGVTLHRWRLDDLPLAPDARDELCIRAERQAGDERQVLYTFTVSHAGLCIAQGRAAIVLNATAPS